MADSSSSPQEAVTTAMNERAADAFAVLGNETRLTILLTLWEAYDPFADDNTLSFSTLQERVGIDDSGQFNYHLDKLTDRFIKTTDEGYLLRQAGHNIIQAVVADVGVEEPSFESTEIEVPCPSCGSPVDHDYDNRRMTATCPECGPPADDEQDETEATLMNVSFPPAGVANRMPSETILANGRQTQYQNAMRLSGVCPDCSGVVNSNFKICREHNTDSKAKCSNCGQFRRISAHFVCTVCKSSMKGPPSLAASAHPIGVQFSLNHGLLPTMNPDGSVEFDDIIRARSKLELEQELISEEPLRVKTTLQFEDDVVTFVFNEAVEVVDVDEDT